MNWITIGSPKTPTLARLYLEANPDDLRGLAALLGNTNLNMVTIDTEPRLDVLAERMGQVEVENRRPQRYCKTRSIARDVRKSADNDNP